MADILFNNGKGRLVELYRRVRDGDPANAAFVAILLQSSVDDATMKDFSNVGTMLSNISNTEASFTNYTRQVIISADLAALGVADNATDTYPITFPSLSWVSAGGAINNTMTKLILAFDYDTSTGTDANLVPLCAYDFTGVTSGVTITLEFPTVAFSAS